MQIGIPKRQAELRQSPTTKKPWHKLPVAVVKSDVNFAPMDPKLGQLPVVVGFVVALLAVALDAHRLIIPVRVRATLAPWDNVVAVHQEWAILALGEQVNVNAAPIVFPRD